MNKRAVAYYRVSTARQGRSGLGLDAQREAVTLFARAEGWDLKAEHTEVESGKRVDRPELEAALAECRLHKATLIIAKLDRLARNVAFVARLMEAGVEFIAVDNPHANRITVHIISAIAEHEREQISARTKAAMAQAKARGVKIGGDRGNLPAVAAQGACASARVRRAHSRQYAADLLPIITKLEQQGLCTLSRVAGALNDMNVRTPRGGYWSAGQVARIKRIAAG